MQKPYPEEFRRDVVAVARKTHWSSTWPLPESL